MYQDQAGVDEVEAAGRRRVGRHVVPQHLDHATADVPGPRHVDVGGDHRTRRPDPLGQPEGTDAEPAPTSQHRMPAVIPSRSTCRNVTGSNSLLRAPKRMPASDCWLSSR